MPNRILGFSVMASRMLDGVDVRGPSMPPRLISVTDTLEVLSAFIIEEFDREGQVRTCLAVVDASTLGLGGVWSGLET
jgi:hypothetical protein